MNIVYVVTVFAVLILMPTALCFSEFFKIRYLYRKKYDKKLLYKQYVKATKIMQDKKITELLKLCDMQEGSIK